MGDDNMMWIANEGVRISKILARIKGLSLSGAPAALRKQLLESEKGWVGDRSGSEAIEEGTTESAGAPRSLTTPFQFTISVSDGAKEVKSSNGASGESVSTNGGAAESMAAPEESHPDELVSAWQQYEASAAPMRMPPALQSPVPGAQQTFAQSAAEWLTATR